MPQIRWSDIDLKVLVSMANFCAICIGIGMMWSSTTGDISRNKQEISDLKKEVVDLRRQDTSIAVIKADLSSVKDNVTELKNAMQRIEARVIDRLQQPIQR
jgi:hypothetical protein